MCTASTLVPFSGRPGRAESRVQAGRAMGSERRSSAPVYYGLCSPWPCQTGRIDCKLADLTWVAPFPCSSSAPVRAQAQSLANQSVSQTRPETTHPHPLPSATIHPSVPSNHTSPHSSWLSQLACLHRMIDRSAGLEWRSAEAGRLVSGEKGKKRREEGPILPGLAFSSLSCTHPGMCV